MMKQTARHAAAPALRNLPLGFDRVQGVDELMQLARGYRPEGPLPVRFDPDHYSRVVLFRDEFVEVALICFGPGQTSSVHDHQGSNCVISVQSGKAMECVFEWRGDELALATYHDLRPGDVSGLDGHEIHQISNLHVNGTVLLNFYSPPFAV
jgi:predicted metal-dependent enzyme (double-stranded beta helix superfamily)